MRFLRRIQDSESGEASDSQLLAQFVADHDEAAFAGIVQRHGAMVFGVCRRVLGDTPDAEDAFQATFLVLARRAATVARPQLLGNWLYGVAHRTSLKARAGTARTQTRELDSHLADTSDPASAAIRRDLRRVLDEELSRLPERYRVPLVLCYLEGQTQEEAARLLGCPRKTVTTRLARAAERLRVRLTHRGWALPAGALAALMTQEAAAVVPNALHSFTIHAAALAATGEAAAAGAIPAKVAALAREVSHAMFLSKLRTWGVVLLTVAAIGLTVGAIAYRPLAAETAQAQAPAEPQAEPAKQADPKKDAVAKTDLEKLQGLWALSAAEAGGKKASPDELKMLGSAIEFADDKVRWEQGGISSVSNFKLDATKGPKELDLFLMKTELHLAIYRLDGDKLTICKSHPPDPRPAAFATKEGVKWPMLLTFHRAGDSDHAKLQGTWTITASEVGGKAADGRKGQKVVFAGSKMTVVQPGKDNEEIEFKLDPFSSPKHLDLTALSGPHKGVTLPAIYVLEGDNLKLCLAFEERRPSAFATESGRKMQLMVLKREP